jgi:hypothetical protein
MSTQQNVPTVSSSTYGGVKAWLYNNYVDVENAAAAKAATTSNDAPPALLSRAQFDRIHLKPMIAGFAQTSLPRHLEEPFLAASETEVQSGVILLSPIKNNHPTTEIFDPMGSVQYARSECSSDDYYMIDSGAELGWYARVRGLSFCSAYEETRFENAALENAALEGYNADVEDNSDTLTEDSRERQHGLTPTPTSRTTKRIS